MRYIVLKIALIIFLFGGCDLNNEKRIYRLFIENESGVNIRLEVFNVVNNSFVKNIDIPNSDFVMKDFQSSDMGEVYGIQDFFEGDSVKVIFGNNLRIESYKCEFLKPENNGCNKSGNIANDGDPKWQRQQEENLFKATYTFTEEDFENASPCDGNCN